jgi:hypothetical protein
MKYSLFCLKNKKKGRVKKISLFFEKKLGKIKKTF